MKDLSTESKLRLVRFVCSFAWADLEIAEKEREFVRNLLVELELDEEDAQEALRWLDQPPREDEVDPFEIPKEEARIYLKTVVEMVGADDVLDRMELEAFAIFEELINEIRDGDGEEAPA